MHESEHEGAAWRVLQMVNLEAEEAPSVLAVVHRALYAAVRRSGKARRHRRGVCAWPFVDPGERAGVVIMGPLHAWCPTMA